MNFNIVFIIIIMYEEVMFGLILRWQNIIWYFWLWF